MTDTPTYTRMQGCQNNLADMAGRSNQHMLRYQRHVMIRSWSAPYLRQSDMSYMAPLLTKPHGTAQSHG